MRRMGSGATFGNRDCCLRSARARRGETSPRWNAYAASAAALCLGTCPGTSQPAARTARFHSAPALDVKIQLNEAEGMYTFLLSA